MTYFEECLLRACEEYAEQTSQDPDFCAKVQVLVSNTRSSTNTKKFLADLKQVLQSKSLPNLDLLLKLLVPLYLNINNKNASKKVLSSFFQGLPDKHKETVFQLLCERVQEVCKVTSMHDTSCEASVRQVVDMLSALMENFALGEACVTAVASTAVEFMASCQDFFFCLFRQGRQSAVWVNTLMHDCHVTMQVLNRMTQRHLSREPQHLPHSTLAALMQRDIDIMLEEQMMVDCRCCCAINLVLLLQIAQPDIVPQVVLTWLGTDAETLAVPDWLKGVDVLQLRLSSVSPMTSLALFWGMLSMLSSVTILTLVEQETQVTTRMGMVDGDRTDVVATKALGMEAGAKTVAGAVPSDDGNRLVCEVMLEKLLSLDEICQTTSSRVQCIKTVTLWSTRMMNCLKEPPVPAEMQHRLRGQGNSIQNVLNFVWTHWQDQLDVMRQNSRIIFDNCLKIHVIAAHCEDASTDPFLLSLLRHVMEMGWSSHSKFAALTSLVRCMGALPILLHDPFFPTTLLLHMTDQGLACHASELYEVLISQEKQRAGEAGGNGERWLDVWVEPIIKQLCSSNRKLKQFIVEYILPQIVKKNKTILEYMLKRLSSSKETGNEHLGALIVCLRRARAWGLMSEALHTQDSTAPIWTKIYSALSSPEEQVRLDAFALLCESKRTTEIISKVEFRHLRHFITYNLNNQSPAFRQAMLSFIKKLLFRINEGQQAMLRLKKKKEKEKEMTASLQSYSRFLTWLQEFLFSQLYPSSAFARRTMSLAILSLLVQELSAGTDAHGFRPLSDVTDNHVHTLLECLTDTFEENKQEAFKLLLACTSACADLLGEDKCKVLYSTALQLAISTRPQDCGTAAYLLKFLLHQPGAIAVMTSCKPVFSSLQSIEESKVSAVGEGSSSLCGQKAAGTPGITTSPTYEPPEFQSLKRLWREVEMEEKSTSSTLQLLQALLLLLLDQVSVAQTSLILAAANRPIYPTLHCIRYILDGVDFRCLPENLQPAWSKYLGCLLQICLRVASVVSPVVQNSSPEGNVPDEAVLGPGLKFDLGLMAEVEESRQTVSLMPEYLVVCCWRSIKEVSLLLGHLSLHVPIIQPDTNHGLFSLQQVEEIGHYFKQQLMESLHRGAFELAYAGFVMLCQMLWKNPWSELQMLPRQWLEQVMSAIISPEESSGLCATRRSAGVPFFIQAIVATETASSGRPSFHQAISQLLQIALSLHTSVQLTNTDGQVHALNILRALFKDARLGEDVAPYVCDGLKAAILGFKSQFWEIRNSATLLLSALMTRIFGVKRSKDESVLSKQNSQTGRAFFHKYPALYTFLLTELEMATQNMGSSGELHLHPSLYPVLMVLGHLFPSTMEGTTTRLNLAAFIPHVIRCSSSPVYKTRMMAARALQPLAGKEQLTDVLTTLLAALPRRPTEAQDSRLPHSHIHGVLLQVYHLLLLSSDLSNPLLLKLGTVCIEGWLHLTWLIERHNICLCTRKSAMDVTDLILSVTSPIKNSLPANIQHDLDTISNSILRVLHSELVFSPSLPCYSPHTPFLSEFLSCVARLSMRYLVRGGMKDMEGEEVELRLLGFDAYEVHLAVLDNLIECWDRAEKTQVDGSHLAANQLNIMAVSDGGDSSSTSQTKMVDAGNEGGQGGVCMTVAVVTCLLDMGLAEGAHTETVIKIFQLLSMSKAATVVSEMGRSSQVFIQVQAKIKKARSADVKAALIQFSGCLFPFLYCDLKSEKANSGSGSLLPMLHEWSTMLRTSCDASQPDDLLLSCAYVLQDNCTLMLVDQDGCLGPLIFDFWSMLVTLLQADDLEVKDVVASVSAKLCFPETSGSHPEQALGQLLSTMFHLHSKTKAFQCLTTALSWITTETTDLEDGAERLFDKGELNTFQDDITLVKLVTEILQVAFSTGDSKEPLPVSNTHKEPSHILQACPTQSRDYVLFPRRMHLTQEEEIELTGHVQRALSLAKSVNNVAETEKDFLESLYLSNANYCSRTLLLIKILLLVNNLKKLLESLQLYSGNLKMTLEEAADWVRTQVQPSPSCTFFLGTLTSSL